MKFEIKKKLVAKTDKIKSVDFHPTFPWILLGLYKGSVQIYDYNSQQSLQYLEITTLPIRSAKFIPEKNWIICGADDKKIRVYNYNTMEKVKEYEAHSDFIRCIVINPKDPYILSCSDDTKICMWNLDNNFSLVRSYDEHSNFVMKIAINPKDTNMFASASMDNKVKIWSFTSNNSHLTLEGHLKGVTTVAFCPLNDKPYLASGSDDKTIRIWDYTNKHCIFQLDGHEDNISAICFHPELPLIITGAEDNTCKFWNVNTFKLEDSKIFGYETVWDITSQHNYNMIGMGCEEGIVVMRMGSDQPIATFSNSQAKIIYAKQNQIFSINMKMIQTESKDGEVIDIQPKSLGTTELFPMAIKFSPNGRHFAIVSDKEFVISTSGVYRSSCVGNCTDLAWTDQSEIVAKNGNNVILFKNLTEYKSFKPGFTFDNVFGGSYIAVKSADSVYFYDFETQTFLRNIDVSANSIIWNENKNHFALVCDEVTYILKCNNSIIEKYIEDNEGKKSIDEGCLDAFETYCEINDKVVGGIFLDEVFIYVNNKNKLNYAIEEKIFSITTLNNNYLLLGYLSSTNRIYMMDKSYNIISYGFPVSFINYQMSILKKDYANAKKIFSTIPEEYHDKITKFLEKFEYYDICYDIVTNPNQKFGLALKLKKLSDAKLLADEANSDEKWKQVADLAMELSAFKIAEECMILAKDFNGLLLYYSCINNRSKLQELSESSEKNGYYNVAYTANFLLNNLEKCLEILIKSNRYPEAALFCRTYYPSRLAQTLDSWNQEINAEDVTTRIDNKIINPMENIDMNFIAELENSIGNYYNLAKEMKPENLQSLIKFNDIDLESYFAEKGTLEIDLKQLLLDTE